MAKYAIITDGIVTNVIEADHDYAESIGAIAVAGVGIGYHYSQGTFTAPAPPKPIVPQTVTMRQARLALLNAKLLSQVNSAIAAMTGDQGDSARIEWEFSSEVKRTQPMVVALGPALGLSSQQIDALFIAAAVL